MTGLRIARRSSVLLGAAALFAACSPSASGGPGATSGAVGTPAPLTQAPASLSVPTEDPGFSFALPPLPSGDTDLEALLPDALAGQQLTKFSMTGELFLGMPGGGTEDIEGMLQEFGKDPSDLSVAFGGTDDLSIQAYKIDGVPAGQTYAAYLQLAQATGGGVASDASFGGKAVKKVVSADGTVYVYASGDVLFSIIGDDVSPELLDEAFSKLP